jgi:hypothetical protein
MEQVEPEPCEKPTWAMQESAKQALWPAQRTLAERTPVKSCIKQSNTLQPLHLCDQCASVNALALR